MLFISVYLCSWDPTTNLTTMHNIESSLNRCNWSPGYFAEPMQILVMQPLAMRKILAFFVDSNRNSWRLVIFYLCDVHFYGFLSSFVTVTLPEKQ